LRNIDIDQDNDTDDNDDVVQVGVDVCALFEAAYSFADKVVSITMNVYVYMRPSLQDVRNNTFRHLSFFFYFLLCSIFH
jgi:hypothetical protein